MNLYYILGGIFLLFLCAVGLETTSPLSALVFFTGLGGLVLIGFGLLGDEPEQVTRTW